MLTSIVYVIRRSMSLKSRNSLNVFLPIENWKLLHSYDSMYKRCVDASRRCSEVGVGTGKSLSASTGHVKRVCHRLWRLQLWFMCCLVFKFKFRCKSSTGFELFPLDAPCRSRSLGSAQLSKSRFSAPTKTSRWGKECVAKGTRQRLPSHTYLRAYGARTPQVQHRAACMWRSPLLLRSDPWDSSWTYKIIRSALVGSQH